MPPILELKNVSVRLDRHAIVRDVSFAIEEGESIAIMVGLGFAISLHWHLPLGPTIVAVASLIFAASLVKKM